MNRKVVVFAVAGVLLAVILFFLLGEKPDPREVVLGDWVDPHYRVEAHVSPHEIRFSLPDDRRGHTFSYRMDTDKDPCEMILLRDDGKTPFFTALLEFEGRDKVKSRSAKHRSLMDGGMAGNWQRMKDEKK